MASQQIQENAANINRNRKRIYELENVVKENKTQVYLTRSGVLENQAQIMRNYQAAFGGNRQLANANTDDAFRNRLAIIRNFEAGNDLVKKNYKEAMINRVNLDQLDHRSKLNGRVTSISEKLAEINSRLIEVNIAILQANEDIVTYNADLIQQNKVWLDNGFQANDVNPESNAKLIEGNKAKIDEISKRASENAVKNSLVYDQMEANRARIETNCKSIYERRQRILENRSSIKANQKAVANLIYK